MKRLFMVLLVVVYVTTVLLSAILPVVKAEGAQHEEQSVGETVGENGGENEGESSGLAALQASWLAYIDFTTAQLEAIFADPAIYMGYEAVFDVECWSNFQYAADPAVSFPGEEENMISGEQLVDAEGNRIRVKINGYAIDAEDKVWYRIEAAPGYTLPQLLVDNPYIMHAFSIFDIPSLIILPQKAMFLTETVEIKKEAVVATRSVTLPTAELPLFFDVLPVGVDQAYFNLGDTTGWHAELAENGYCYVSVEDVYLIAPEVTVAYEKLQQATSAKEYNEIWESIPESVREQFTEQHLAALDERQDALYNVTYSQTVMYNGKELGVSVSGPIPETGVTLHVSAVSGEDVLNGGFDVKSATDIITALDIKLLREDHSEWQPEDGERIYVSIDVAALGIEDESVVQLHHKHGEEIYTFEVVVVLDGKVVVGVNGLSMYVVNATNSTNAQSITYQPGATIELTVGEPVIYYFNNNLGNAGNNRRWVGTWQVTDPTGAVFYEVFSNEQPNHNSGMLVRWIRIVPIKEATNVKLTFNRATVRYQNNNPTENSPWTTENYTLNIVPPESNDGRSLYLQDTVNTDGRITAVLVNNNGEVIEGLEGAAFNWTRSDGLFIAAGAYENSYRSINIAKDHAGLVEARKEGNEYAPVTYTLTATLADGTTEEAEYTVYYQSEFLNASFEAPKMPTGNNTSDYCFFPNGWHNLFWETTAPGTGGDLIRDIEYGEGGGGDANFGLNANSGTQFAELNAQEFGALYQDIISAPHEEISWQFSHAARINNNVTNNMFVVIGATETAQYLIDRQDLIDLGNEAKRIAETLTAAERRDFNSGKISVTVTYKGAMYSVWYHQSTENEWELLGGSYDVPEGQYRTRLFFVSDPAGSSDDCYGNLIDSAKAGQYKTYLIEYYVETFDNGKQRLDYVGTGESVRQPNGTVVNTYNGVDMDEDGEALVYSSVKIDHLDNYFVNLKNYYLHRILINGQNAPYNIRYAGDASLYIEKYDGTPSKPVADDGTVVDSGNNYGEYDIVMQVFFRDTVIAVKKELVFPTTLENPSLPESPTNKRVQLLTEEQKLKIMEDLNNPVADINGKGVGYEAVFSLQNGSIPLEGGVYQQITSGTALVTQRDPAGNYTAYISLGHDLSNGTFVVEETDTSEIPGLILDQVTFETSRYQYGVEYAVGDTLYDHIAVKDENTPLHSSSFELDNTYKIAELVVRNIYREKETTIYYKAVGKGKVQLTTGGGYQDIPSETLAFYSGQAVGAVQQAGNGATFVGWFTDPECKNPITAADGVYDETTKIFKPNANIINAESVTFYAKFDTGAIVINRENAFPGQIFVYRVQQTDQHGNPIANGAEFYVTVAPDKNGKYSETIVDVPAGHYTVTEIGNWSWRHPPEQKTEWHRGSGEVVYTFTNPTNQPNWLSGLSDILKNVFTGTGGVS